MATELTWDGKYKDGKKVAPVRVTLPFQTVETINESTADRQRTMSLFAQGRDTDWRNRLIWGDKKYVLPSLLPEFAGKVNLIYIDPPFNVGADFSFTTTIPDSGESFTKEPSIIEQKAYRDTWGRGMDSYLQWFYETAVLLHELLAEDGSIYVHLDWHIGHYAKLVLDEVFGIERFVNEIVWRYGKMSNATHSFPKNHDTIYLFGKNETYTFNPTKDNDSEYKARFIRFVENNKVSFGVVRNSIDKLILGRVKKVRENLGRDLVDTDILFDFDVEFKTQDDVFYDISIVKGNAVERIDYPTQKPEALLERILKASSNEGDLVLDCFCGSGTTAAVAEKLNRRWITCDLGRFAIHTARKRLLGIPQVKPFVVQNLGKYERQAWQAAEFADEAPRKQELQRAYTDFILNLYHAQRINGYAWLHGLHNGRMVHVGAVDAPVSTGDVANIAAEFKKAIGTGKDAPTTNGVDVMGWDFAFELNETARQQAAAANINMRFLKIPRDVMDKRAVAQGDIKFFELAALAVETKVKGRDLELRLTNFIIPPDDVPEEVQKAVIKWEQWIDYWAVDWDNHGDTFHNEWQSYRSRKEKSLKLKEVHRYDQPGKYRVVVKVVDILGNDTTKSIEVTIA